MSQERRVHANNAKLHTGSSLIGWAALTCVEDWHSRRGGHSEGGGGTRQRADVCHYASCWRKERMQMKINALCGIGLVTDGEVGRV